MNSFMWNEMVYTLMGLNNNQTSVDGCQFVENYMLPASAVIVETCVHRRKQSGAQNETEEFSG